MLLRFFMDLLGRSSDRCHEACNTSGTIKDDRNSLSFKIANLKSERAAVANIMPCENRDSRMIVLFTSHILSWRGIQSGRLNSVCWMNILKEAAKAIQQSPSTFHQAPYQQGRDRHRLGHEAALPVNRHACGWSDRNVVRYSGLVPVRAPPSRVRTLPSEHDRFVQSSQDLVRGCPNFSTIRYVKVALTLRSS